MKLRSLLACLCALALPVHATWSIVAVDTATGEVAVASATCVTGLDLQAAVPAIVVGKGAGAAQSAGDPGGGMRQIMVAGFHAGLTAQEILDQIAAAGLGDFEQVQFGVVPMVGPPKSRSGALNGDAAKSVMGTVGTIKFAIQGNLLTGDRVIRKARDTFKNTSGDLSQRIMAAMETARFYGGDGRCSCRPANPTACGSPPDEDFTKTAHIGFITLARIGDVDGTCSSTFTGGCANGDYWLSENVIGNLFDPDPVFVLQNRYDAFRQDHRNRPDGVLSRCVGPQSLPADGESLAHMRVELRDIDDVPLDHGRADVTVTARTGGDLVTLGPPVNHQDGTYTFDVQAGFDLGEVQLEVRATQAGIRAVLFPYPALRLDPRAELHCGFDTVQADQPRDVPFLLNLPDAGKRAYLLLGSSSGTGPGYPLGPGLDLPLNKDVFLARTLGLAGSSELPGSVGVLDLNGRARATFVMPPVDQLELIGMRLDWAALILAGPARVTNVTGFDLTGLARKAAGGSSR